MSTDTAPADPRDVLGLVERQSERVLRTYSVDPGLIQEHANSERRITAGGYGDRQVFELVQNAADEIRAQPGGRVQVVLTKDRLYCANEGTPVTPEGAETILRMGVSRKRGGQIGRFGVGVKSVLSVSDAPEFFSRTGCFGFDKAWSASLIRAVHAGATETPVLRMARALDEKAERASDPVLDELLGWATTVVRLPLLDGAAERLGRDLMGEQERRDSENQGFPSLFQLFSNHVGTVVLEDRRPFPKVGRQLEIEHDGPSHTIREARTGAKLRTIRSRVFSIEHVPTPSARTSAGELHDRVTIDISWAVPEYSVNDEGLHTVPAGRGAFWSFFPTKYHMSLSGVLNAAWKTNEDRQNLLDGSPFNQELLQVSARLVLKSLPGLVPSEDPAAYLALLPGRVTETLHWADEMLTRQIWAAALVLPSLPDQDGVLRTPDELDVHPKGLTVDLLRTWAGYEGRPRNWVHHSVEAHSLRHGKLERILAAAKKGTADVRTWLEALVSDGTAEASAVAIRILADLIRTGSPLQAEARNARIVLTEAHGLVASVAGQVFKRTVEDGLVDDLVYVDPRISADGAMLGHLDLIGIRDADAQGRFRGILDQGFTRYNADSWTRFWELLRSAGGTGKVGEIRTSVADPMHTLQVRVIDGQWRPLRDCLLPGPVVPADGSRDAGIAVDTRFHADDLAVLRELGVRDRPTNGHRPEDEPWFEDYRQWAAPKVPTKARIQLDGAPTAGPLHHLFSLSPEGRAAFLKAMPDDGVVQSWTRQIGAQASTREPVQSPLRWLVRARGTVETSRGLVPLREAVGPQLQEYEEILPVARISSEKARKLGLPVTPDGVPPQRWEALLRLVLNSEDDAFVGTAYATLLAVGYEFPEDVTTRCRIGDSWASRADGEIAVASTRAEYDELVSEQIPALLVSDDPQSADAMIKNWGMLRPSDMISKEIRAVPAGPATAAVDEFPPLRQRLGHRVNGCMIQRCTELEQITRTPDGTKSVSLRSARQDSTVLVLDPERPLDALVAADREFGWGLGTGGCQAVISKHEEQQQDQLTQTRLNAIRGAESVIDKIALLIDPAALRAGLPEGLMASEIAERGTEPDARRLAEMAYNAHDEGILRLHAKDISRAFPHHAPTQFTGTQQALQFVASLGFPDSFAGASVPSLEPRIEVDGPSEFPALHEYQERLAANLFALLEQTIPQRAMLSLPTGAGKTRVASEGVIRWIRQRGKLDGPILWIAQTDELCEQAVQSWRFVWSKVGAESPLVISRLWNSREATPVDGRPHLVVATDAKLQICLGAPDYAWLRNAALVLVDEAHMALSPRYTEILERLGLTHSRTERHLVGLTATPYRNNAELTHRLVQRFGDSRLDHGIFDGEAITELQELGVLARVRHRELTGATIQLTSDELSRSEQFQGLLPKGAEQRLADDHSRNQRIVDEIAGMPDNWPVLVFATSVAHAKFLAAKLGDRGIRASAIDSATPIAERRKRIEAFRNGEIRVLTNYGVLTQGFDAPATRAVVVARPTFSPNIYQQMIGRGLRGPRNGGTGTCLILNVRDNITNYGEELAFDKFEHLWGAAK